MEATKLSRILGGYEVTQSLQSYLGVELDHVAQLVKKKEPKNWTCTDLTVKTFLSFCFFDNCWKMYAKSKIT